jgi:carboxylate-amine ligase
MQKSIPFTYGIEEEFFLVDPGSRDLVADVPREFLRACRRRFGEQVHEEMQSAQVEIATAVLGSAAEARQALAELRGGIIEIASGLDMRAMAAGTHPSAAWAEQNSTNQPRYDRLLEDFQIVGRRNLVCGLHVHVAVPEQVDRVDLMNRLMPWIPLFLALSTSSPFWSGRSTGLMSYRQALYDEWPRSGIPDAFDDEAQYADFIDLLANCGALKDGSFLWWAVRPSARYPTLELRISDSCTRVDDTLALASAFRCLVRAHVRRPSLGASRSPMTRRVLDENRWRAKRYGVRASFIDEQSRSQVSFVDMLGRLRALIAPDAAALKCEREIRHLSTIALLGTSADAQLGLFHREREKAGMKGNELHHVIDWLADATAMAPSGEESAATIRRRPPLLSAVNA